MPVCKSKIYVFGEWRLDPAEHLLLRNGDPVPLTPKVFDTLLLLVENAGRLVTKDEFMKRVWPDAFVEDLALVQNISQIRKALATQGGNGESSSPQGSRVVIETVPKLGYRFLAPVQVIIEASSNTKGAVSVREDGPRSRPAIAGETQAQGAPQQENAGLVSDRRGGWHPSIQRILIISAVLVIIALAIGASFHWRRGQVLAATDKILLADFENNTGDPSFDVILKQALRVKLNESPYLNFVSDRETLASVKDAGPSSATTIPRQAALTLCSQVGAHAVVVGQISSAGTSAYKIVLVALRCGDGTSLARAEATSSSRDDVISALGLASDVLRKHLGEAENSAGQFHTPLGQATTNSLAALKAFSLGEEKRAAGQDFESIPFYKMATDLDPGFALAYARLGIIYGNANEMGSSHTYLHKAFDLRDHATERERLYIAAHYYAMTGEAGKHVDVYRVWHELYPRDVVPVNNLAYVYLRLGQPESALDLAREALHLSPENGVVRTNAMNAYHCNGQFTEAKALFDETVSRKLDGFGIHLLRYSIASAEGDESEMKRQLAWARENPRESEMVVEAALYAAARGQVRTARALFRQAESLANSTGSREHAGQVLLYQAEVEAAYGSPSNARAEVDQAWPLLGEAPDEQAWAALILGEAGAFARLEDIAADLKKSAPLDVRVNKIYLPTGRAAAQLKRGKPEEAMAQLRIVEPYDLSVMLDLSSLYYRGAAELALHHHAEAVTQFQKLIDHQAISPNSPYVPLAHLALARAYFSAGEIDKSRSEYEIFLNRWSHSDPDLPLALEAKKEYASALALKN
ncbi:MAG: transcriptional regulator, CadC [Candidatus Angelobacter sp.]|jgi:DNA-binding winged helix-turn-helix (wHTH) protein/tetratricopeptide (TPR) repeat protein|nr:transcriptional regulator, CadC [Candidatus Angelobacter sp.]